MNELGLFFRKLGLTFSASQCEELIEIVDGIYHRGWRDGFERGAYEEMTQEDVRGHSQEDVRNERKD